MDQTRLQQSKHKGNLHSVEIFFFDLLEVDAVLDRPGHQDLHIECVHYGLLEKLIHCRTVKSAQVNAIEASLLPEESKAKGERRGVLHSRLIDDRVVHALFHTFEVFITGRGR